MSLTTNDCREWLAKNRAHVVLDMFADPEPGVPDPRVPDLHKDALNPKNWKRHLKYDVGSAVDIEGSNGMDGGGGMCLDSNPRLMGGIASEFYLTGDEDVEDGVRFLLVEKDGEIVFCEEIGD